MRAFLAATILCVCVASAKAGIASCYGREHGQTRTATGALYNPWRLTAAHRTLAFGTRVLVCNLARRVRGLAGGEHAPRCAIVTINDRGPFVAGRAIDLSLGACRAIGNSGLARVSLQIIGEVGHGSHCRDRRHYAVRGRR